MGEALRHDRALGLLLQRVVADRLGRAHAFLDVARLEDGPARRALGGPHAGIAVGLKLDPDLDLVALGPAGRAPAPLCARSSVPSRFWM